MEMCFQKFALTRFLLTKGKNMVTSLLTSDCELDYEVTYREVSSARSGRDVTSRDRLRARARFQRHGGRGGLVNGAHRRRDKRNYL